MALALFLLAERAKGPASRWVPYISSLPADSGSPVQWADADLAELRGTQVLQTAQAYRCGGERGQGVAIACHGHSVAAAVLLLPRLCGPLCQPPRRRPASHSCRLSK